MSAVFSPDRKYRYWLEREIRPTGIVVAFNMLNPSTADEKKNDPTVRRCIGYATDWGASKLIVTNIFGLRSTDPKLLYTDEDPVGPENDAYIIKAALTADVFVCAWGAHGKLRGRQDAVMSMLRTSAPLAKPCALKINGNGTPSVAPTPAHPLYQKKDVVPIPFR